MNNPQNETLPGISGSDPRPAYVEYTHACRNSPFTQRQLGVDRSPIRPNSTRKTLRECWFQQVKTNGKKIVCMVQLTTLGGPVSTSFGTKQDGVHAVTLASLSIGDIFKSKLLTPDQHPGNHPPPTHQPLDVNVAQSTFYPQPLIFLCIVRARLP